MEVLNAARLTLTPVSLYKPTITSDRKTEPRKLIYHQFATNPKLSTSSNSNPSSNLSEFLSKSLLGTATVLYSSIFGGNSADALTYEEAIEQSLQTFTSGGADSFDLGGLVDSIVQFGMENPAILAGGATVLAVPLILASFLQKPKGWGVKSAITAYSKLAEDGDSQLLDIRGVEDIRMVGSPDLKSLKKRSVSIPFVSDKVAFLKKVYAKFKVPTSTTLFILDKYDGNSTQVAELVTANGFKAVFAIKDGAEGSRGWMNSKLPWSPPNKSFPIDFSNLKDALDGSLGEDSDAIPVALGLAAATGFGVLAFAEIETALQLLGSAAAFQFITKKLLFAEDRKVTLQQIDEFLNTKVAPKEHVDEIKGIGKALLPASTNSGTVVDAASVQKVEDATPVATTEEKVDPCTNPSPKEFEVNSVPKPEITSSSIPGLPRPLSPYPNYPDLKPPSSPCPSQP
ncbi:rhodanese-like domain-containing protein 4, chloroplastic [Amborella trichopoda]|uniref:Rhodanese domain-containing protein n=1 Tax=Amborella trichopoda TaxID=13333 RepID=W1PMK6_AMBTC|nr:rhodanese-like domain-containing protein 4, chloroplastic [Amborella trichopoda]ERN08936.1 hypothetical protein AMTR_s00015p00257490 [Amborella trichopoda]|eukprot:XP_006847355.1 rhodanese-like domain-containing protein 4, chloroplastic [Amborella trichopoda]